MKNPELFAKLLEWQIYLNPLYMIIAIVATFITLYYLSKIKKNSDNMLKMKIYEFEKNNPEKPYSQVINDRYAFIRVKF